MLALREATAEDAELLLAWRNDPVTRANSFEQGAIELESHRAWLTRKLASPDTRLWILTDDGVPAGQVRYDRRGHAGEVSVAIAPEFRGRGFGSAILRLSAPRACSELALSEIRALVKPSNQASLAAFERAGFQRGDDTHAGDDPAALFLWRCR
jgi:RimJ/RimL family protein N-acetyltransferase